MNAADIYFLPSKMEGIALGSYEAMSCATVVVSADVGGQRELVTSACGYLISPSNMAEEAARYADLLIDLIQDPEKRTKMGLAGRDRIKTHFSLSDMGEKINNLLMETIDLSKHDGGSTIGLGVGRYCARQAVEYTRLADLADRLWLQKENWTKSPTVTPDLSAKEHLAKGFQKLYRGLRRRLLNFVHQQTNG
jgi:hypothetical protein